MLSWTTGNDPESQWMGGLYLASSQFLQGWFRSRPLHPLTDERLCFLHGEGL